MVPAVKSKKPKDPPPAAAMATVTGADTAQEAAAVKKNEKTRIDFTKSILRPAGSSITPNGLKTTLG